MRLPFLSTAPAAEPAAPTPAPRGPARRTRLRLGFMRGNVWLHRWVSLVAGLILLVVVLSGVALIWQPEIHAMLHRDLYDGTATETPVSEQRALAAATAAYPDFTASDVIRDRGVYLVENVDYDQQIHVDPGTGRVLGMYDGTGVEANVFGFLENLHLCGLTCEEYPGYVPFLADEVPVIGNASFPLIGNEDLTWGGLILGFSAIVLLFLSITGIIVWWPGLRRMARGFTVRRHKGAYAVNYDLHKVVGVVAIPFLLMWAVTGASYEFKQVGDIWYWAMPGGAPKDEDETFVSTPVTGESVSMDQARAIAERTLPGRAVSSVSVPDASDPTSAYSIWMQDGLDPYAHGGYPGDVQVSVDRYSGAAKITYGDPGQARVSEVVMEEWNYPVHAGVFTNGWWRIFWLVFGLTPLLLAITGVVTWLMRRRRGRRGRAVSPTA